MEGENEEMLELAAKFHMLADTNSYLKNTKA